jgi:hypothetical protein
MSHSYEPREAWVVAYTAPQPNRTWRRSIAKTAADDQQAIVKTAITAGTHTPKRFGIKMNGDRQLRDISEDEFIEILCETRTLVPTPPGPAAE